MATLAFISLITYGNSKFALEISYQHCVCPCYNLEDVRNWQHALESFGFVVPEVLKVDLKVVTFVESFR